MIYEYKDILNSPDLANIHIDIANSVMTNKSIEWCRWDEDLTLLRIKFESTLSPSDKLSLDDIVFENL